MLKTPPAPPSKSRRSAASRQRAALPAESADATPNRRRDILQAAEALFAAKGFHGVSIRDIAQAAEVPLALVGYYFGPKVELYQQIYRERAGYIQIRLAALAQAQALASPGELLEEIVKAFVLPVLDVAASANGRHFLRLIARGINDQLAEDEVVVRELFDPLALAFIDALHQALPQSSRATVTWCYQFALGALLLHVNDKRIERLSLGENRPGDDAVAGPVLVRFITEGLRGACRTT
jgi:AcrR family transcriptional regulator